MLYNMAMEPGIGKESFYNPKEEELRKKFDEFLEKLGLHKDADGILRFQQWGDALDFQQLAKENGLEVAVIEPSISDLKNKVFLANYYRVYPRAIKN